MADSRFLCRPAQAGPLSHAGIVAGTSVKRPLEAFKAGAVATFIVVDPTLCAQGPAYQTDDPVPVESHHQEFHKFGGLNGTKAKMGSN